MNEIVFAVGNAILGALGVPFFNYLKRKFGIEGTAARWMVFGITGAIAVLVTALFGMWHPFLDISDPWIFFARWGEAFSVIGFVSKQLYETFWKKQGSEDYE